MGTKKITTTTLLISFTGIILIEAAMGKLLPYHVLPELATLGLVRLVEIIVLLGIFDRQPQGLSAIGLKPSQLLPGLRAGLWWSITFLGLVSSVAIVLYLLGINPIHLIRMPLPKPLLNLGLLLLVGGVIGPIAEEIIFRGILYEYLRAGITHILGRRTVTYAAPLGIITALMVSNLVFVVLHSAASPIQAIGGILFTLAYEKEKKLSAPITIHVLGNLAIFGVALLNQLV